MSSRGAKTAQDRIQAAKERLELKSLRLQTREVEARSRVLNGLIGFQGDFDSARPSRSNPQAWNGNFSGIGRNELTPDEALAPDQAALRKQSNSSVRNDSIGKGIMQKVVQGVISTGVSMRPAFDRVVLERLAGLSPEAIDAYQEILTRHWSPWADTSACDYGNRQNFYMQQSQVCHVEGASGEAFVVFMRDTSGGYGLKLKRIHPQLCATPPKERSNGNFINGVEIDPETEAPLRYWFIKDPAQPDNDENYKAIDAMDEATGRRNVLHIYNQLEPGQTRGIPRLASDLKILANIKRVNEANVLAELVRSYFTAFITTQTPGQFQTGASAEDPVTRGTGGQYDSKSETPGPQVRFGAGAVNFLRPGEGATIVPPQSNSTYEAWLTAHLKILGMSQGIPYEVLMDSFNSSYSASRAARLAWEKFCHIKRWQLVYQFMQPVVEEFIWTEEALGRLDLPGYFDDERIARAYEHAAWDGDALGILDPENEAKAAKLMIETGLSNLAERTTAITGGDWKKVAQQRAEEVRTYKQLGLRDPTQVEAQRQLFDSNGQPTQNGGDNANTT